MLTERERQWVRKLCVRVHVRVWRGMEERGGREGKRRRKKKEEERRGVGVRKKERRWRGIHMANKEKGREKRSVMEGQGQGRDK